MKLKIAYELPPFFCELPVEVLHERLGGPTLFHLNKEGKGKALFLTTLLHGNEHSGYLALQKIFKDETNLKKRPILLFIGNTMAAAEDLRQLPEQNDFNRVWSGGACELAQVASEVKDYVLKHDLLCSIDIHNNSGKNPFYCCVNKTTDEFLGLAKFFADPIVFFTEPHEVHSLAFSKHCPAITIEAGKSAEPSGVENLISKIAAILDWSEVPKAKDRSSLEVYHTVGRIKIDQSVELDFEFNPQTHRHFSFRGDIEDFNFQTCPAGTTLAYLGNNQGLTVVDNDNQVCQENYLVVEGGELKVARDFIAAMLHKNLSIIHSDCLGYIMERYPLD